MLQVHELPKLNFEEFKLIRDFVHRHCGLFFPDDNLFLMESRLRPRLQTLALRGFHDYYLYLRFHRQREAELEDCIDALTTNETYFFREQPQLRAFSDEILENIRRTKLERGEPRTLRVWSAGCSTGEEPYTIAMLLLEKEVFSSWRVEIFGTDISQRVLQLARQGQYGQSAFRTTDSQLQSKYFENAGARYRIRENVRRLVSFGHLNLLDRQRIGLLPRMDVIFCRNVIIYFDLSAKRRVVESFYDRLVDGGYLLLGHSESLLTVTTAFTLEHLRHDLVYRKPVAG